MKKETTIYGVQTGETFHYIGKTDSETNPEGNINKSDIQYQYRNKKIRSVFTGNPLTTVVPLKVVKQEDWYDEKLQEVVKKYGENNPLVNAQWMLDGKRGFWDGTGGYWEGKKRDAHTLQRLSESKYQKFCQYDQEGRLVKVWNGGKEAAEQVFGDYEVINGCGKTRLYQICKATKLAKRLAHNSYWFKAQEMLEYFGGIPNKLNLALIYAEEQRKRFKAPVCQMCGDTDPLNFYPKNRCKCKTCLCTSYKKVFKGQKRHEVIHYNIDGSIKNTYRNTVEAAFELKVSVETIQRLCRGVYQNANYNLKYGEKVLQLVDMDYDEYEIQELPKPKRVSKAKKYQYTRTRYSVELVENQKVIKTFGDIREASQYFQIKESAVRRLCREGGRNKVFPYGTHLRLGAKTKVLLEAKQPVQRPISKPEKVSKPVVEVEKPISKPVVEVEKPISKPVVERKIIIVSKPESMPKDFYDPNMFDDIDL